MIHTSYTVILASSWIFFTKRLSSKWTFPENLSKLNEWVIDVIYTELLDMIVKVSYFYLHIFRNHTFLFTNWIILLESSTLKSCHFVRKLVGENVNIIFYFIFFQINLL